MNRYQFEDLISDYLENKLSISKRKIFEDYVQNNPECRELIESVKTTVDTINSMKAVSVSNRFMDGLNQKIDNEKNKPEKPSMHGNTFFGFTPGNAGVFSLALFGFIWMGFNLLPDIESQNISFPSGQTQHVKIQKPVHSPTVLNPTNENQLVATKNEDNIDSTNVREKRLQKSYSIDGKATFVKDK